MKLNQKQMKKLDALLTVMQDRTPIPGWSWVEDDDSTMWLSRDKKDRHDIELSVALNIPDETGEVDLLVSIEGELGFIPWPVIELLSTALAGAKNPNRKPSQ